MTSPQFGRGSTQPMLPHFEHFRCASCRAIAIAEGRPASRPTNANSARACHHQAGRRNRQEQLRAATGGGRGYVEERPTVRSDYVRFAPDSVAKVPKGAAAKFFAKERNKRQSPINAASNPLLESPVSLAHGGVAPHIIFRSPRLRLGEFKSHPAKRLLQHYPRRTDIADGAC